MNPFMQDGYLTSTASLNMLPIADGVTAKDLCAARIIMARLHGYLSAQGIEIDKIGSIVLSRACPIRPLPPVLMPVWMPSHTISAVFF